MGKINNDSENSSSPIKGSINSDPNHQKTKIVPLPQLIEFSQQNVEVSEIAAGDCHALALSNKRIFAWGQGALVSSQEETESQEVVCNMPVMLGGGYHNTMTIESPDE